MFILLLGLFSSARAETAVYTIQDAYNSALRSHEAVKIAEESRIQTESRVDQAKTYLYPRLTGNGAYTRYNEVLPPGGGFVFQPIDEIRAGIVLTQPLYTGGRTMAAWRAAMDMNEASRHELASTRQSIMAGVAESYYAVIKAQKLLDVSKQSLVRMERHKKVTEREAATRKTKANASALLRANTLVNQARIGVLRAEDGLTIARQRLSLVTNLPADIEVVEPDPLQEPEESVAVIMLTALQQRDDYARSQLDRKVSEEFVAITQGGHYPQVYAEGGIRYTQSEPNTQMDGTIYYGGLRLQIPIFEGGLMKYEVSEARSKQRQADLASSLLKRRIEAEVHEAYINYQTITAVLATAKLQLADARSNFDAVEGLFAEGLVPSLSLIDAEQALSLAERELVSVMLDRQLSIIRLEKSVGMLGKRS
ncbi:MAG: TolC family protein [Nitrospirota bacterium]|nr:TolC family protein [Nitrospirota bacterium]